MVLKIELTNSIKENQAFYKRNMEHIINLQINLQHFLPTIY